MSASVLTVDVGNTSIGLAVVDRGLRVRGLGRLDSSGSVRPRLARLLKRLPASRFEASVVASVVPRATRALAGALPGLTGKPCFTAGRTLRIPILNRYRVPSQVGVDRLMNAVAVHEIHGRDAVVIDFGTATTFDAVSARGVYLGGAIAPGIEITLEALYSRTALLPRIRMAHPRRVVGRDTAASIRSGCAWGMAGLCERLVAEISRECRFKRPLVIATGGYARFLSSYYRGAGIIEPDLVHKGIALTYWRSKGY